MLAGFLNKEQNPMASRMLHYCIALEVMKEIEIKDKNRFWVGVLLPDASSHQDDSYNVSHFYDELEQEVLYKGVNWKRFAQKYREKLWTDDLYLGYLCHLIMDAIWFHDVADKYVRIYPYPARADMYQKGYEDFNKLNIILPKEYALINPKLKVEGIDIEEVKQDLIPRVYEGFAADFAMEGDWRPADLEVYPYETLQAYMKKSKTVCIGEIEAMRENREFVNPQNYFSKH